MGDCRALFRALSGERRLQRARPLSVRVFKWSHLFHSAFFRKP